MSVNPKHLEFLMLFEHLCVEMWSVKISKTFSCFLLWADINWCKFRYYTFFLYFSTGQVFLKWGPLACMVAVPREECKGLF